MCPACLPHRLQRHCRLRIVVRVEEEGLGDLKRAPLIVMSEYFVVLHARETRGSKSGVCCAVCLRCGRKRMYYKRELEMFRYGRGSRCGTDTGMQRGAGWVVTG